MQPLVEVVTRGSQCAERQCGRWCLKNKSSVRLFTNFVVGSGPQSILPGKNMHSSCMAVYVETEISPRWAWRRSMDVAEGCVRHCARREALFETMRSPPLTMGARNGVDISPPGHVDFYQSWRGQSRFFYFELTCNGVVWSAFRPRPAYFWRHNNTLQDDLLSPLLEPAGAVLRQARPRCCQCRLGSMHLSHLPPCNVH